MTRRLILLRHGQTAWNRDGRFQGHTDIDLDETGAAQADAVAPLIAAMRPALLWSSDLTRARRTAERVAAATGLDLVLDRRLREYDVGERAGLSRAELKKQSITELDGVESHAQVSARVLPALQEHWGLLEPGETGVVVMHGAALRTGMVALLGWPIESLSGLRGLDNCGWVELGQGPAGSPQLMAYNRVATPISSRADPSVNVLASS